MLLSIQGGSDLGLFEINEAARLVQEAAHPEANIIFGAVIDDALGDEVRVTVIAAGFDGGAPVRRRDDRALGQMSGRSMDAPSSNGYGSSSASTSPGHGTSAVSHDRHAPQPANAAARPQPLDAEPLERSYGGQYYTERPVGAPTVADPVQSSPILPSSDPAPAIPASAAPAASPATSSPSNGTSSPSGGGTSAAHGSSAAPAGTSNGSTEAPRSVDVSAERVERPVRTPARPVVLDDDLDVPDFLK